MEKKVSTIYKLISKLVLEIILVVVFMIVSYSGFTMNNLTEASKIASASSTETRDIQIIYNRNEPNVYALNSNELVDHGVLTLKNPNKTAKSVSVVLQLKKSEAYSVGDLYIDFGGEQVETGVIMNLDETYEIILGDVELDAYERISKDVDIYSINGDFPIEYSFKIVGSF